MTTFIWKQYSIGIRRILLQLLLSRLLLVLMLVVMIELGRIHWQIPVTDLCTRLSLEAWLAVMMVVVVREVVRVVIEVVHKGRGSGWEGELCIRNYSCGWRRIRVIRTTRTH